MTFMVITHFLDAEGYDTFWNYPTIVAARGAFHARRQSVLKEKETKERVKIYLVEQMEFTSFEPKKELLTQHRTLTEDDVAYIKEHTELSNRELGNKFGVAHTTIARHRK